MNRICHLASLSVASLFATGCNGGSNTSLSGMSIPETPENQALIVEENVMPSVGGYSTAAVSDKDIIAIAEFAVFEESKKGNALTLVSIDAAEKQVVAGMNYRVSLTVEDSGSSKQAEAVVYRNLESNLLLTSWNWK